MAATPLKIWVGTAEHLQAAGQLNLQCQEPETEAEIKTSPAALT